MSTKFKNHRVEVTENTNTISISEIVKDNDFRTADINYETVIKFLQRKKELLNKDFNRDEQKIQVNYTFQAFAEEGAYAVFKSVIKKYGNLDMNPTGPSGGRLPEMIDVKLPDGSSIKVPWGNVSLPSFEDDSRLEMTYDSEYHKFKIIGTIKNKYSAELEELIGLVREELELHSI